MGKILAILAAGAVAAGGATFAVFHHLNPYGCPLSGCDIATVKCCADPTTVAAPTSEVAPDSAVAVAGPVGMFVSVPVSAEGSCCSLMAKPAARTACCADAAPAPTVAALVGPAAAR